MDKVISEAEKSLKKAPKGSLKLSKSNGSMQYYHRLEESKELVYISKKNESLVKALAQKDYDQRFLKVANNERKQVKNILYNLANTELMDVYAKTNSNKKELITPYILTDEQYVERWKNVEYNGKKFDDDLPLIVTERGERVRSKSEKIIADKLYSMGIPYRYEFPLKLGRLGVVYPDFTLLNMNNRKEIYMEHFGMMDDAEYCKKAISKIEEYERNGIYIGKNLIVTFETSKQTLNTMVLEKMVQDVLLRPYL